MTVKKRSMLILGIIASAILLLAPAAAESTAESSDFTFDSQTGTITGYIGTSSDVIIPDNINGVDVKVIGGSAFEGDKITSVVIPNTVTEINDWAFSRNNLVEVDLPDDLRYIGVAAFESNLLTSITIPDSVTTINDLAFSSNLIASVTIPGSVTYLSGFDYNLLTEISIPASVKNIGEYAFFENKLTTLDLPDTVVSAGYAAFARNNISSLTISANISKIEDYTFYKNALKAVTLPDSVTTVGQYSFKENSLTEAFISADCLYYTDGNYPSFDDNVSVTRRSAEGIIIRAGADRYATAVEISKASHISAETAILALGTAFPDALTGGPLSYLSDAPILLVKSDSIPQCTEDELKRLGVTKVILLGGVNAVGEEVVTAVNSLGITVKRASGDDRFGTAVEAAKLVREKSGILTKAVVVCGTNFPDALSIGSYAASEGIPILLTSNKGLNVTTEAALKDFGIKEVIIIGGTASVSVNTLNKINDMGITTTRIAGTDRYGTAAGIAAKYFSEVDISVIVNGINFPDALSAVPYAAMLNAPILPVKKTEIPGVIGSYLNSSAIKAFRIVGGESVVSQAVRNILANMTK